MRVRGEGRTAIAIWAVVIAAALVASVLSVANTWVRLGSLVAQLVLAASGALLWPDRGHRGYAKLLLAASAAIGVSNLDSPAVETGYWIQLGWLLQWVPVPLLVPVLLGHSGPAGPSELARSARWLVPLSWVWALGPSLVSTLTWDPAFVGYAGPARWVTLYPSRELHDAANLVGLMLLMVLATWFTTICVQRWRAATGPLRASVRLVSGAGTLLAIGLVLRNAAPYAVRSGLLTEAQRSALDIAHNVPLVLAPLALFVVAVRTAARRGSVVERLLAAAGNPVAVEEVLRRELHDPTLTLRFVDANRAQPAPAPGRIRRRLAAGEDASAIVDADAGVLSDPAGLRVVLAATSVVLANTRLTVERAAHLEELESSRARIVEAGEAQRRQLERDLHDGAQQHLLAVATTISRARLARDETQMGQTLDEARSQLADAMDELRRLARGIHPAALSQAGLGPALEALARGVGGVEVRLGHGLGSGDSSRRLDPAVESTAYFVAAEAVTNARKHSSGSVLVLADCDESALRLSVADRGPGGAVVGAVGGLRGLVDRAAALGGSLEVTSPPHGGTVVHLELPLGMEGR